MSAKSKTANVKDWPGAFGVYNHSKQAVKQNLGTLLALWLFTLLIGFVPNSKDELNSAIIEVILFVISCFITAAMTIVYINGVRGQKISLNESLNKALPLWLRFIWVTLATMALLVLSLIALVIPFFFVLPRLALVSYYLVDKNMGVADAIKASWNETKGHSAKVWGIFGVSFLMVLLFITIIGIPVAIYLLFMYSAAMAVLYQHIQKQPKPKS